MTEEVKDEGEDAREEEAKPASRPAHAGWHAGCLSEQTGTQAGLDRVPCRPPSRANRHPGRFMPAPMPVWAYAPRSGTESFLGRFVLVFRKTEPCFE